MTDQPTPDATLAAAEPETVPAANVATPEPVAETPPSPSILLPQTVTPAAANVGPLDIPDHAPIPALQSFIGAPASAPASSATPLADLVAASSAVRSVALPVVTDQRQVTPGNFGVATQVANPRRTTWRTFLQAAIGLLIVAVPLANAVLVQVAEFLKTQHDLVVPSWAFVAVNVGIGVSAFIIALVARIMVVPGVAAFIARYLPILAPVKTEAAGPRHELN